MNCTFNYQLNKNITDEDHGRLEPGICSPQSLNALQCTYLPAKLPIDSLLDGECNEKDYNTCNCNKNLVAHFVLLFKSL